MDSMTCPICKNFTFMYAQCEKCGGRMCMGCYPGNQFNCKQCGGNNTVKVKQ